MAKRVVQECDLTKQEYDPAETVTLIIKKNGKKTGRTYELSSDAAARLEQQLVSGNKLPEGWSFHGVATVRSESNESSRRTLADLDSDAAFVAQKKKQLQDEGIDVEPRQVEEGQATVLPELAADNSNCLHMNKGPIQTTMKNGERHIYRTCRACRGRVPEKMKDDRQSFLNAKPPSDSRVDYKPALRRDRDE